MFIILPLNLLKLWYSQIEGDVQAISSEIPGMLSWKNSKNQKKQSVQLFCQKNSEFPIFCFQSCVSSIISLENGSFKANFYTRLRLVKKYAFQDPFPNSIMLETQDFMSINALQTFTAGLHLWYDSKAVGYIWLSGMIICCTSLQLDYSYITAKSCSNRVF